MNTIENNGTNFISTSDFVEKLNECIRTVFEDESKVPNRCSGVKESSVQPSQTIPKFELRSRFEDGTTRLLDDTERRYADYKFKSVQAAQIISHLQPHERLEWAQSQRNVGNRLFSQAKYIEAMDIYMTCLVALDQRNSTTCEESMDEKMKLPILLNISTCMLKMGMFQKTEKICNLIFETMPCSWKNPKVFYRRGRARTFMGLYEEARKDYNQTLNLLSSSSFYDDQMEIPTVHRAIMKLDQLIEVARLNQLSQKKAMQRLLGGKRTITTKSSIINHTSHLETRVSQHLPLYDEMSVDNNITRTHSKLKALPASAESSQTDHSHKDLKFASATVHSKGLKEYFFTLLAYFLKFVLYLLGDKNPVDEQ